MEDAILQEQQFRENIINLIDAKGLKYAWVAKQAGYPRSTFSDLIHGKVQMKMIDALRIAKVLNLTLNDILAG